MKRIPQLDGLRGLLIVIITINHTDNYLTRFTYQTFGYASAAEGFVFLSGLVASMAYNKRLDTTGVPEMTSHAFERARTIYLYHLAVLLSICIIVYFSALHASYWKHMLSNFLAHPFQAVLLSVVLLYQPSLHDILPLYCILFLCLPWLILQFRQKRTRLVFSLSVGLWLVSQLGLGPDHLLADQLSPYVPGLEFSKMNIFAWQLLFVSGVYIGTLRYKGASIRIPVQLLWVCVPVIAILTVHRHTMGESSGWLIEHLAHKTRLGILRLVNFASLVVVISLAMQRFPALFNQPWLIRIGKHSLQVFALHILLIFTLEPVKASISQDPVVSVLFVVFVIFCLYAVAFWREKQVQRRKQAMMA